MCRRASVQVCAILCAGVYNNFLLKCRTMCVANFVVASVPAIMSKGDDQVYALFCFELSFSLLFFLFLVSNVGERPQGL